MWILVGDDNRAEDGIELRAEFIIQADIPDQEEWRRNPGCSMLEMFIAFSKRAEYMTIGITAKEWFWEFMDNLRLKHFNDAVFTVEHEQRVDEILHDFTWRTYNFKW